MYTPHLGRLWVQNSLGWPWTLRMFLFSIFLVKFTLQVSGFLGKLCICSINCKLPLLHLFWWAQVELTWKTGFLCPSSSSVWKLQNIPCLASGRQSGNFEIRGHRLLFWRKLGFKSRVIRFQGYGICPPTMSTYPLSTPYIRKISLSSNESRLFPPPPSNITYV